MEPTSSRWRLSRVRRFRCQSKLSDPETNHEPQPQLFAGPRYCLIVSLGLVAVTALAIGWTAGAVAASSGSRAAHAGAPASSPVGADTAGAPGGGREPAPGGRRHHDLGAWLPRLLYPVPGYNSLGVAPEGTILVQWHPATAAMKADGSDQGGGSEEGQRLGPGRMPIPRPSRPRPQWRTARGYLLGQHRFPARATFTRRLIVGSPRPCRVPKLAHSDRLEARRSVRRRSVPWWDTHGHVIPS